MAVDRKNTDTDEKHSLSSFDKRKVQSVTFGGRQHCKKYKVAKKTSQISNNEKIAAAATEAQAEKIPDQEFTKPHSDLMQGKTVKQSSDSTGP